jgi:hypothetical protein
MQEFDGRYAQARADIDTYEQRLREEAAARFAAQRGLAFSLARVSPAAAFGIAAARTAGTDVSLRDRFEEALSVYRSGFVRFVKSKQQETGDDGRIRITAGGPGGLSVQAGRRAGSLDVTGMPSFVFPAPQVGEVSRAVAVDLCLLVLLAAAAVALAAVSFLRYDAR